MSTITCNAVNNDGTVRCEKEVHLPEEQHWGHDEKGMDVVWMSITLAPPNKKENG